MSMSVHQNDIVSSKSVFESIAQHKDSGEIYPTRKFAKIPTRSPAAIVKRRQLSLVRVVNGHHSPISQLPPELLLYIFEIAHASVKCVDIAKALRPLSQVSYLWRELLINTPRFWTHISVSELSIDKTVSVGYTMDIDRPDNVLSPRVFPWTVEQLRRARDRPLFVSVDLRSASCDPRQSDVENIRRSALTPEHARLLAVLLRPHAFKFRRVDVMFDAAAVASAFNWGLAGKSMPLLQTWRNERSNEAYIHKDSSQYHPYVVLGMFMVPLFEYPIPLQEANLRQKYVRSMYPQLRELTLSGFPHNWSQFCPNNLRSLFLGNFAIDVRPRYRDLANLLYANAHSLEVLGLQAVAPLDCELDFPIVLPKVHTLVFEFSHAEFAVTFVECLQVPNLRRLKIRDIRPPCPLPGSNTIERHRYRMWLMCCPFVYDQMMTYWPLQQVVDLTLLNPQMLHDLPEDVAEEHSELALGIGSQAAEFFGCFHSLERLHICDPHVTVYGGLMYPIFDPPEDVANNTVDDRDVAGQSDSMEVEEQGEERSRDSDDLEEEEKEFRHWRLPCPKLRFLDICSGRIDDLRLFLLQQSSFAGSGSPFARRFDRINLNVPPEWGSYLRPTISRSLTTTVFNSVYGYFISGPIPDRTVFETHNAAPMLPVATKVKNLVGA